MPTIDGIIKAIEAVAPTWLQESYDNSGLQVGNRAAEAKAALLCTDVTEAVFDEALARGCNLVVSHHPLLFHGLKRIDGSNAINRIVIKAIKNDIAIYSAHTSMDNAPQGVSHHIAKRLQLANVEVLEPQPGRLMRLVVYTPRSHAEAVAKALWEAGAGRYGNYDCCSFSSPGTGTFRALDGAHPFVGEQGELHAEEEVRQEFLIDTAMRHSITSALIAAHPYEEPAFDFIALSNESHLSGSGVIGTIAPMPLTDFLEKVKAVMEVNTIKYSSPDPSKPVAKVALCGGAGAFLAQNAIAKGADIYITGDVKYHDFLTYGEEITIADIGHDESEHFTKEIFYEIITEKFPNFATYYSEIEKNPINFI